MVATIAGTAVVTSDELTDPRVAELLHGERLRSLNVETKLLLAAARAALRDAGLTSDVVHPDGVGVAVATRHAGLQDYVELYMAVIDPERAPFKPTRGPQTGLNAPAAHLSIRLPAAGPNATVSNGAVGGFDALRYAREALAADRAEVMLVCEVDLLPAILRPSGAPPERPAVAAVVVLQRDPVGPAADAPVRVGVAGVATAFSPHEEPSEAAGRATRDALGDARRSFEDVRVDAGAPTGGEGVVEQLARAVDRATEGVATARAIVRACEESCSAGAAILVASGGRESA